MMMNLFLLVASAVFALPLASGYPDEWAHYTSPACVYDVQSGQNDGSMSETSFRNYLVDLARTNLAKSVKINISDRAELAKQVLDGRTSVSYFSSTAFSADVELSLVKTASVYDKSTKTGYAIAYIEKQAALDFYRNAALMAFDELEVCLRAAENYIAEGLVPRAKERCAAADGIMDKVRSDLFLINFFGAGKDELSDLSAKANEYARRIGVIESKNVRGTLICLDCRLEEEAHDEEVDEFEKKLKGLVSKSGCSFTDSAETADWTVSVDLESAEYNVAEIGGMKVYSVYANAGLTAKKNKGVPLTIEDAVSQKGVHTLGYEEARRDAYGKLAEKVAEQVSMILIK